MNSWSKIAVLYITRFSWNVSWSYVKNPLSIPSGSCGLGRPTLHQSKICVGKKEFRRGLVDRHTKIAEKVIFILILGWIVMRVTALSALLLQTLGTRISCPTERWSASHSTSDPHIHNITTTSHSTDKTNEVTSTLKLWALLGLYLHAHNQTSPCLTYCLSSFNCYLDHLQELPLKIKRISRKSATVPLMCNIYDQFPINIF